MAEAAKAETKTFIEALSPINLVEAQKHNTAFITEVNELTMKTARDLWESQADLFRIQSEQATKGLVPVKTGASPAAAIAEYCDQQHERTAQMVAHMRKTNDLVLDYGWKVLGNYNQAFKQAAQNSQPLSRNAKA